MRGPSLDDVLAVSWGVCGLGVAAYFVVLARENDDMGVSPVALYGFAAVALIGSGVVAVRHARHGPLNRELVRALPSPWRWVDAEEPVAAGDLRRRSR